MNLIEKKVAIAGLINQLEEAQTLNISCNTELIQIAKGILTFLDTEIDKYDKKEKELFECHDNIASLHSQISEGFKEIRDSLG